MNTCPDCERPNQFGELCRVCYEERRLDYEYDKAEAESIDQAEREIYD